MNRGTGESVEGGSKGTQDNGRILVSPTSPRIETLSESFDSHRVLMLGLE